MRTRQMVIAVTCALVAVAALSTDVVRAAPSKGPEPTAPTSARRLVFRAEFDTAAHGWSTCYPWWPSTSSGCTNEGNVDEQQWYTPANVKVAGGVLSMDARQEPTLGTFRGEPKTYPYTSGMIQSRDLFSFKYGYAEFRMKLAPGNAMWDAAWLLPVNWNHRGEIDVLEGYGQYPSGVAMTYHALDGLRYRREIGGLPDLTAGFHTYGVDWEPYRLTWYLDGKKMYVVDAPTPAEPMYLIANLAVAGRFITPWTPGAPSGTASVDYVRVWQR
jgi:beta-glucanase (GH16 family)